MHRNGYQGRKFHREKDQRESLLEGLAEALIIHESIQTTITKAKEIRPIVEKLITRAKIGGLANRRYIIRKLQTKSSAHKLIDELAPKLSSRNSGYLRISKTVLRRGDNTQMARISFIFDQAIEESKQDIKEDSKENEDQVKNTKATTNNKKSSTTKKGNEK